MTKPSELLDRNYDGLMERLGLTTTDQIKHYCDDLVVKILQTNGSSNALDILEEIKRNGFPDSDRRCIERWLDKMVRSGKIQSKQGKTFVYYSAVKPSEIP